MKKQYFSDRYKETERLWAQADKKRAHIANLRLAAAVVFVLGLALWLKQSPTLGMIVTIAALAAFLILVRFDQKMNEQAELLGAEKTVLERYLARFSDDWYEFSDDGGEYLDEKYTNGVDLDIFGKRSVFQYISIAHTMNGRDSLARALKGEYLAQLGERAAAVQELSQTPEGAIKLESIAQKYIGEKKENREQVEKFLQIIRNGKKAPLWKTILSFGLPVATITAVLAAMMEIVGFKPAFFLIAAQLFLSMYANGAIKDTLDMLYDLYRPLAAYDKLAKAINTGKYEAPYLKERKAKLGDLGGAEEGLRALSRISAMLKVQNSLFYLPLCGLMMWNYHALRLFNNWCLKYGRKAGEWFQAIGDFEELYSLAMLSYVKEEWSVPTITEDELPQLKFTNATHPLLEESKAVANSFAIDGGMAVITGSNMSGKTTFLRTIGVNLTLAYAGGLVCAEQFSASKMRLMTSMRITDDVSRGISTFYGELLRIKGMVEYAKEKRPLLTLIDEIFKGTNSADRIIGAEATLKTLNKPWVLTLVSTHDFELCDLAQAESVKGVNYHFEEYYDHGRLKFDYTIKPERCHTSNAQALMKMVGILEE